MCEDLPAGLLTTPSGVGMVLLYERCLSSLRTILRARRVDIG